MNSQVAIILLNPKTPHNVGGAIRACSIFGVPTLRWTGTRVEDGRRIGRGTGSRSKSKWRLPREERMKAYKVDWQNDDEALDKFIKKGYTPVCVELRENAESLVQFVHPEKAVYVFGPEDSSVDKGVLTVCHRFVRIPGSGCLNLAASCNVVLYDRWAKQEIDDSFLVVPKKEVLNA